MTKESPATSKQTAYLAGPMRGIPEYNFPAFYAAAAALRAHGLNVWSPAENDVNSQGAQLEVHVAQMCGIPVYNAHDLTPVSARSETVQKPVSGAKIAMKMKQQRDELADVLRWLDRKGGLGLDVHARITKALDGVPTYEQQLDSIFAAVADVECEDLGRDYTEPSSPSATRDSTPLDKLAALMVKEDGTDVDICSPGNHGGRGKDANRWLITLMPHDARNIREFFGDTLEEAISYAAR